MGDEMDFFKKALYVVVAVVVSLLTLIGAHSPWVGLAVVLCFIFGPKIYRSM
jgi:uncharacterized membrane protein YkgB